MKTIKRLALALLFAAVATAAEAQIKIPGTKVSFQFPNGGWKYLHTTKVDDNTSVYLYSYNERYVIDSVGDTVLPFMRIYVHRNYQGSAYEAAYSRFLSQPFQSLDEYVDGLPSAGGIGYLGAYTNETDGKDYEFRMIYFKERSTLLEIRLETTRDNYDDFEEEFKSILRSVKINK